MNSIFRVKSNTFTFFFFNGSAKLPRPRKENKEVLSSSSFLIFVLFVDAEVGLQLRWGRYARLPASLEDKPYFQGAVLLKEGQAEILRCSLNWPARNWEHRVPGTLRTGKVPHGQGKGGGPAGDTNVPFWQIAPPWKSSWGTCGRWHYDSLPQEYNWSEKSRNTVFKKKNLRTQQRGLLIFSLFLWQNYP